MGQGSEDVRGKILVKSGFWVVRVREKEFTMGCWDGMGWGGVGDGRDLRIGGVERF